MAPRGGQKGKEPLVLLLSLSPIIIRRPPGCGMDRGVWQDPFVPVGLGQTPCPVPEGPPAGSESGNLELRRRSGCCWEQLLNPRAGFLPHAFFPWIFFFPLSYLL